MKSLFTTGFEGRTVELPAPLKANRAMLVVDVRALPLSHQRGHWKKASANALEGVGIAHPHRVAPGTAKWMRLLCKRDNDFRAAFDDYLEDHTHSLLDLIEQLRDRRALLLLRFEADPALCHRSLVAAAAQRLSGRPAKHL